ncbi:MAG: hypothetical protein FWG64_08325 [Firmicutes bacterium]|nr:hypothetical protein [Bacillota bacterium]
MKKKVIASALALVLALGASGVTAFASEVEDGSLNVEIEAFSSMLPNPMPDPANGDNRPPRPPSGGGSPIGVNPMPEPAV